jgi:predicted transcriptional regulator
MATSVTTTLRMPTALRDQIARLAEERGTTMIDVVSDAIRRLERDRWWSSVHEALDAMTDDEWSAYSEAARVLDAVSGDGLRGS